MSPAEIREVTTNKTERQITKENLILTFAFLTVFVFGISTAQAQDDSSDEIEANPNAPAGYDANLKSGDSAVASSGGTWLQEIKIVSKSNGVYKATLLDSPNENVVYYRANSVYPYFDRRKFAELLNDYRKQLEPYVECYAKKNNLEFEKVKGESSFMYYIGHGNAAELRGKLQADLPKLAELERQLKSQLKSRPNTFLEFEANPSITEDIAVNREQYFQCVTAEKDSRRFEESVQLMAHRDGIAKDLKTVEDYDPATKRTMATDSEYMYYAVSMRARTKWLTDVKMLDFKEPIDKLLTPLAEALAKKLPTYFPSPNAYNIHNAAEEAKLKTALENPARYKIFKIGLSEANWLIDANVLGIPTARYKHGRIYVRDTEADHPYCYATYVNLKQDYAGGGTYAATYAEFIQDELVGCPPGVK